MLKITQYQNAHEYIKDSWEEKRKRNPNFSIRAWSKQLGMASHSPLILMLNGKRTISKKHIPALIKSLSLTSREGLYLETLIEYNQSKTASEKDLYYTRLKDLVPSQDVQLFEMESFRFLGNPLHCQILDMSDLKEFKGEAAWIKSRLIQDASIKEIDEVLNRLITIGLFKRDTNGRLKKTHQHLSNRPDIADLGSQEYHKNISILASEMVSKQKLEDRQYDGYSMSIKKEKLPKAKKMLYEFAKQFMNEIEVTQQDGEETYQLNLQFFSITKTPKPIEKK